MFRPTAGVAQLVERQPSKLQVAGSNLVSRSRSKTVDYLLSRFSSVVEHFLGKEEVMGSNPINGSAFYGTTYLWARLGPGQQEKRYAAHKPELALAGFRFLAI
jgi:hypothetical protein